MQKFVLVDFNGVVNNPLISSNSFHVAHKIKEEICLKKMKILMEFVVKHNAIPISVSSFSSDFSFLEFGFLLEEEYPELALSFEELFLQGMEYHVFSFDKNIINKKLLESLQNCIIVCFEDQFTFDSSFNQIWTKTDEGITDHHIQQAENIFKKGL